MRVCFGGLSSAALCAGLAIGGTPGMVQAQEQSASEVTPDTTEIVVTAQGREQRLQDVPISASVINGATLQRANLRNLEELTARLPAVKLTSGPASDLLNVRGVGSGLNGGFEQSVATFVDGVYRGRSRSSRAALFDVERVEVLKGPQTTFFGNNAIAGALNIATRRAQIGGDLSYNASALYAPTDGEYAVEAGVSAPLGSNAGLRVAAKAFGMDGYVENTYLDEDGPRQRDFVARGSLAWEPMAEWRSDLRIDYGRFRDTNSFPAEIVGCPVESPPYPTARGLCQRYLAAAGEDADGELDYRSSGGPSSFSLDFFEAAWTNAFDVGDHTLTAITSYYDHDAEALTSLAPFPFRGLGDEPSLFSTYAPESYHSLSQELRVQSPAGQPLEYVAGAYFSSAELDASQVTGYNHTPFGANAPGYTTADTPISARYLHHQRDRTLSIFASFTGNISDALRLNGGLRYSVVRKRAERDGQIGVSGAGPDLTFTTLPIEAQLLLQRSVGVRVGDFAINQRTDKQLMPSVSLQYDLTGDVMTYASYTRGFKAGGFSISQQGDIFGPETVDAYEVGLKGSLFDRRITFSVAGFLSDYADLQEATNTVTPSGATQTVVANVAQARSQGVEFSTTARVNDAISLSADVAYLDAHYSNYPGAPCTILQTLSASPCTQDLSGARRAYSPEFSGSVGASVTVPVGNLEIRADPSVYFSSRYFQQASADPLTEQEGFAKLDLRLGVGPFDRRWEVALIGKNLTDKATGSFRNNVPTTPGTIYVLPDRPFSVALQVSIRN